MRPGGVTPWRDDAATDVIAGLSVPSFVIVASVLTLTIAVLAGQVESSTASVPVAIPVSAAPVVRVSEGGAPNNSVPTPEQRPATTSSER